MIFREVVEVNTESNAGKFVAARPQKRTRRAGD